MSLVISLLAYSFMVPYEGAGQITIQNLGNIPETVKSLSFVTNSKITDNPYGNLYAYGANVTSTQNPDGITYTYTITEPKAGIEILANTSAQLTYTNPTDPKLALSPLNVGMNPSSVSVNGQTVTINGHCVDSACNDPLPNKVLSGYYTDWDQYGRQFQASQIPIKKMNHIIYAFIKFDKDGNISLLDSNSDDKQLPAISMLRQQYPYLHASLSFGGWTLSGPFSAMAANPEALNNFVTNAVTAMKETGFDGIDIDWEYPTAPQDAANYAKLLSSLRSALDAEGVKDKTKYYLSIAAPAGIDKIQTIQNNDPTAWGIIKNSVNYVNLMTYDYHGAFDIPNTSDHMSAMKTDPSDPYAKDPNLKHYNVEDSVSEYLALGFDKKQLIVGIPAYWRTEIVASAVNNGLYQTITGTPNGQFDNTGVFDYACVRESECFGGQKMPDVMQFFSDNVSQARYGFNSSLKIFTTGDDEISTANKANYANQQGLGGMMIWAISGDVRNVDDKNSLIGTAWSILSTPVKNKK